MNMTFKKTLRENRILKYFLSSVGSEMVSSLARGISIQSLDSGQILYIQFHLS